MSNSISAFCKYFLALVIACMMALPASALTFSMDTVSGAPSDTVTISIRVYDFTDLIAIQGTIQFDPAVGSFVKVEIPVPAVLPGLGAANFGTTQSANGRITFSWDDATLAGVTINDVVIFSIKFKLVGTAGQQSPVTFANSPTMMEFSDVNFNTVPADALNNGQIQIQGAGDPCAGITCDDSDACTTDTCIAGACNFNPIICDDGDNCTTDSCNAGTCIFSPVTCDDGDDCTTDFCTGGGCQFTQMNCDDGDACTTDSCIAGACDYAPVVCNDNDACTTDGCDIISGCTATPITCDDGDGCTTDGCDLLTGCTTAPVVCDDSDACTTDSCANGSCSYTVIPGCNDPCDTLICADVDLCTTDTCLNAACVYTPIICDDAGACTTDSCINGLCVFAPVVCNDGNACTTDGCDILSGCTTTPVTCNDGDACTTDGCDAFTGCTTTSIVCNDGNTCTTDGCNIVSGCTTSQITCDDGDNCTINACDAISGCTYTDTCTQVGFRLEMEVINGSPNTDVVMPVKAYGFTDIIAAQGTIQFDPVVAAFVQMESYGLPGLGAANFGTTQAANGKITFSWDDATLNGVSVPDTTVIFAIRFHTANAGQTATSFVSSPTLLEFTDVNFSTVTPALVDGLIQISGDPCIGISCDDNDTCTIDSCDLGNCINTPVVCDDSNICTTDGCDIISGCTATPVICDDGNQCTSDDCNPPTGCIVTPIVCNDGDDCTTDGCDSFTGCTVTPVVCDDADICTTDSCANGSCVFTVIIGCNDACDTLICVDGDLCTIDSCINGNCAFPPLNCDDGDFCTTDLCDLGSCVNAPVDCDDADACTNDFCDTFSGCSNTAIVCDDGDACTSDGCSIVSGCTNRPLSCDDGDVCTTDGCNLLTGCSNIPVICDDGDACTTNECITGSCVYTPITCNDFNPCTVDACASGQCTYNDTCISGLRLTMDAVSGTQGTDVVLPIRAYGFTDIIAIQGTVQFDPTVASFLSMESYGLPGMGVANFGTTQVANGKITFSWDDATLAGVSVPNATVLFSIRFNLVGNQGQSTVTSFVNTPTLLEFTDVNFSTVTATLTDGLIQIIGGCVPACDDGDNCTTDECVSGTCEFTPIVCSDGNQCTTDACILGSCVYTPLNCDDGDPCTDDLCSAGICTSNPFDCSDGDLCTADTCLGGSCINTPIPLCVDPCDTLTCVDADLCTIDSCANGSCFFPQINCNDGNDCTTDLCDLGNCLNNPITCDDGDDCTTDLCVGGACKYTPINCDDGDLCTNDDCAAGVCINTGIVCNDNDTCTADACLNGQCVFTYTCPVPFRFKMDTLSGAATSDVVMPVRTYGFTDIIAIQGTIQFDPAVASFVQIEPVFGLPGLGATNFGTTLVSNGIITFSWDDATLAGVSVPHGTEIFSIRFNLVGNNGESSVTSFVSVPTLLEFVDVNFNTVTAILNDGLITISGGTSNSITTSSIAPSIFCAGDNVTVNFTKTGTFNSGNIFTAQLSDANGSFSSPVNIGSVSDTVASPISAAIPSIAITGSNYRIRVVSSSPAVNGTDNGTDLTINSIVTPSVSIAASNTASCPGDNVAFSATPVNGGSTPTYDWLVNGISAGVSTDVFNSTILNDNDIVSLELTSNAACANPTTAISNDITMTISSTLTPKVTIVASAIDICSGETVTFTATPENGGATPVYNWLLNDVSTGVTSSVFSSSTMNTGDSVKVEMTSSLSCATPSSATSNSIRVFVNPSVNTSVTISASTTSICSGASVVFTATPVNEGTTPLYQWKVNGLNEGTNSDTFSSTALNDGDSVHVEMVSSEQCATPATAVSNDIAISVTTSVTPSVSIAASTTSVCIGENVLFTATTINGGTTPSYQWMVNGTNTGTDSDTFSSNTLADNDVVNVLLTSNDACANPDTATSNDIRMTVASSLTPAVSITASSTSICTGDNVTFTASPVNGGASPAYQWQVNGVNAGSNTDTYSSTSLTDNDAVSVILTSSLSCANPDTAVSNNITITIAAAVIPGVSITASSTNICAWTNVTFIALPVNGGVAPSYQWKINGSNTGNNSDTLTTSSLNNNDAVSLVMTSGSSCANPSSATSNTILINVSPVLNPAVSITTASATACINDNVTFTVTPVNGGSTPSYQWLLNGSATSTNSNTFSSASLTDGDVVGIVMISNATCASSTPVSSNNITMSVVTSIVPAVTISVNANNVCQGSTVTFTATPVNGGITPTYQWKIDNISTGPNSQVFLTSAISNGSQVLLEMTSDFSCAVPSTISSNMISMTVGVPQTISLTGLDTKYCVDAAAQTLTGNPTGGSFIGPGLSGNTFVPYNAGPGTYQVGYSFVSLPGCTAITSQAVTVNDLPAVSFFNLDNKYCSLQQTDTLIGTPAGGLFAGTGISGSVFSVPTVNTNTTIPVTYSYTDSNSCNGVVTKVTTINPVTIPVLIGVSKNYCENQSIVSLNASPSGGTFRGDGVTSNFLSPAAAGVGAHTLEYTYIDANNCPNQTTETINVNTPPQVSLGSIATEYCYNDAPVALVGTPSGGVFTTGSAVNGGIFSPNDASPDTSYTIEYTYTDSNQCASSTTQEVSLLNPPFVQFLMDEDSVYCSYLNSVFLDVNIPGGIYYGAGVTGNNFNPSAVGQGEHFVAYYLTNTSGCTGSNKILLKVDDCTGIYEAGEDMAIMIYPNPSEGNFILEIVSGNSNDFKLEVFSIEGKLLMEKEIRNYGNGTKEQLDLSEYAEGMYLLKMNFGNEMILKRVVVSR